MINLTALEKTVIYNILFKEIKNHIICLDIISKLNIYNRKFSIDYSNKDKCCGFYLDFTDNNLLEKINLTKLELDIQYYHNKSSTGVSFILFLNKNKSISFLEAVFYDEIFLIHEIISGEHGFFIDQK